MPLLPPGPVGAGQHEDSFASVRRPEVRGSDPGDLHRETEIGEPGTYDVQTPPKESRNILDDDESRAHLLDDPEVLEPKPRSLASESGSSAGKGEILAGESPADDVDRSEN
jgi:hypothetical protein